MKCPNCDSDECWREEVDIGVGVQYGPYGCPECGWSEDDKYNMLLPENAEPDDRGYVKDQWGGLLKSSAKSIEEFRALYECDTRRLLENSQENTLEKERRNDN